MALKKSKQVISECKESAKGVSGNQWTLQAIEDVNMGHFWDWDKVGTIDMLENMFTGPDRCN